MSSAPDKAKDIFLIAVEQHAPDLWPSYLDEVCADDPELRRRVELLLEAHEGDESLLDSPAIVPSATIDHIPLEKPGTQIGPYKLLQEIGEGGMGVVFMAEQKQPVERRVALKIIKPGMDTRQVIARFEAEEQALAMMDHPNIAKVHDAGTTDSGRPYFVMELVNGIPVTQFCDEQHVTPRERLELFIPICQAVQHAHQKGIIHRDIKPSNILIALYDGRPVPKVIDFGVAKATGGQLTEKTVFTELGQIVGTIEYMSPEQAQRNQLDIDTRSDVYSLGVLLYELLTGDTPFDKTRLHSAAIDELLRIIREEEPPKPSTKLSSSDTLPSVAANRKIEPAKLSALVRGELDWIVMKALEKDRARRYETASSFAADVAHYLNDEPVLAWPPSAGYRFGKFARRNKAALSVAGLILLFLMLLGSGIGWAVRDRAAWQARVSERVELFLADVDRLTQEQQWDEALATVRRAEAVLAGGEAVAAIKEKVQTALKELEFVARLTDIRMEMSVWKNDAFDYAGARQSYGQAFRDFGIDVESLPVATAVAQLKQHPRIIIPVATALDDFVHARRSAVGDEDAGWRSLVEMTREIDPDSVRDQLRALWGAKITPETQAALRELAESFDVRHHSPNTAVSLAYALERSQLLELEEQILRQAQQIFPGDYWVNLELGKLLWERKQFAEAVRFSSAALAIKPASTAALNNLGIALDGQGKPDEAIDCYRLAIELDPRFAYAHTNLGIALQNKGQLDHAIDCYRTAIELDPKFVYVHTNLGNVLADKRLLDQAIDEYRTTIELDPKYAMAHNNLGVALADKGLLDQAIDEYGTAIELDPKLAMAHNNLGNALADKGLLDQAIDEYRKAIELDPKDANVHYNLGNALAKQNKLDQAIAEYRDAIKLDPKLAMVHNNLGQALMDQGKLDEAIDEVRLAIKLDPKEGKAYSNLGTALAKQNKLDQAIDEYRRAIELDPNNAGRHTNLGSALMNQGKLDEAIDEFRTAIELDPTFAMAHTNLGNALATQGKLEKAIDEFRRAIELDPKDANVHYNLGNALKQQGKCEEAIDYYRQAIELDPKFAMAHHNLGNALSDQGRLDEAIDEYCTAIELDPKFAKAHNSLGNAFYVQRKLDQAIAEYRQAIELDPKDAGAYNNLGIALANQDKLDEAIDEFRTAIELEPNFDQIHYALASALYDLGELEEAIECYRQVIEINPKHIPALVNLAWYLATAEDVNLRNPQEACDLARKAIELQPKNANHWCNLGIAEYRAGNWQNSVDAFRQADVLIGGGGDRQHRFFLAMSHWKLGNQAQAHEAYEQGLNWLNENNINDEDQIRFRDEAESLLKNPPTAEKNKTDD